MRPSPQNTPGTGRAPDRRTLKSGILWCARWMLSADEFYRGKLKVDISYGHERDTITVRPTRDASGMIPPAGMEGMEPGASSGVSPPAGEVLRCFLSHQERMILRSLAGREPSTAQDVCDDVKMTRSVFFAIWGNLQQRGIVDEDDNGKFRLAAEWLRDYVMADGDMKPAA